MIGLLDIRDSLRSEIALLELVKPLPDCSSYLRSIECRVIFTNDETLLKSTEKYVYEIWL